ncbi:MAG: SDR family NAD(P)-dependent oxidoreductase [Lachnospiraceae bacterium]|nr:SDR family NAD(P)-dependent oxidoreductase [Lachnospiraceae bacterium]
MKKIAIITGASSGMGRRFAETVKTFAPVDEIWAIARRADRLEELKKTAPYPVRPVALDLSSPDAPTELEQLLKEEQPAVRLLVNASGFGKFEATEKTPLADNLNMIDLNCRAVAALCQLCLPYMQEGSRIVNIASVAAFQPIPYINVYGATKAFVLSYSRALNREVKPRGIRVMALCPFWTKTEFFDRAVITKEAVVKKYVAMYDPKDIVRRAWRDLKRGKDVSIYGFKARGQAALVKILPHRLVMDIWMKQQKL